MKCELVDVFSTKKLNGNGLTIFSDVDHLSSADMLAWTQEMRQFESIFIQVKGGEFHARIFTIEEELDFAGHPLLGLAYHLHHHYGNGPRHEWRVHTKSKVIPLTSLKTAETFTATMSQGKPEFIRTLSEQEAQTLYAALNLTPPSEVSIGAEVISTGLPYVILPVASHQLEHIVFKVKDLAPLIAPLGAKFLYVLDVDNREGRTWDNQGAVEDIATGSAAGPAAAYLFKHGLISSHELTLHQGRFLGRPSEINVAIAEHDGEIANIFVSANVVKVADISLVD
ncbi:PhzF family phenazine biosynthesis protein [Aeromonas simiae]|uniref:PhzF family phenazine biosynthesis protein n=1 Tax=Aeromonas simiae TaxID=218936 RepID=A0A5J6WUI7_9GAMM|nr:PhzF family phenazine biosynthesis protein [Aeromonas simiae]QFI53383.1 PhzF family phenazine biosynthesis protein [Aeromonas simiae]